MNKVLKRSRTFILLVVMVVTSFSGTGSFAIHTRAASQLGKVTSLTLTVNSRPAASLSWDQVAGGADSYKIYRNNKAIAEVKPDPDKPRISYLDETLDAGKSYRYTVKACRISADSYTYGPAATPVQITDGYTYEKKDRSAILTGSTRKDEILKIPESLDGLRVTEIGESCFSNNIGIQRVVIPDGVLKVDDYAFECCSFLQKVYFPDSLTAIGQGAFSGCGKLRLADMQEGLRSIGKGAFLCCIKLQKLDLPSTVNEIGRFAFAFCSELNTVNMKEVQISDFPDRIFCYCEGLTRVILPDSLHVIKKRALFDCPALAEIKGAFAADFTIEEHAFQKCKTLRPESLVDWDEKPVSGINISDTAFDPPTEGGGTNPDPSAGGEGVNPDPSTGTDDGGENPDVGPDPENDDEEFSFEYVMESASGDKSIFDADKYTDYLDIGAGFEKVTGAFS